MSFVTSVKLKMSSIADLPNHDRALLERLSEESVRKHLVSLGVNGIRNLLVFSSITSTNDYLLDNLFNSDQITVCIAEQQTRGRGRYGHEWVSPSAVNIYLSMFMAFAVLE